MKVKALDLIPALKEIGNDVVDKLNPAADLRNPARIFAISCCLDEAVITPMVLSRAKDGVITLPSKETATAALDKAGGVIPFPVELPLGFSFTISLGKSDLEKIYSVATAKEIK